MSQTNRVLALVSGVELRADVDRAAAAAGVTVVHVGEPSSRAVWSAAAAVLLDVAAAQRCAERALPRRNRVLVVSRGAPGDEAWRAAVAVGAERMLTLPEQDGELSARLADAAEARGEDRGAGSVLTVIAGCGGAGATLLAAATALTAGLGAGGALLVDVDPWGGGIDLVTGGESEPGLRWPDLALGSGRLSYPALRDALPGREGVSVLAADRSGAEIDAGSLAAVIDAGCRGGATVVCDVPRRCTAAAEAALVAAHLVILVAPADVRAAAAAGAVGSWVSAVNPNVGLVVRGPAPGGLRGHDVARIVGVPLVAAMRPQPGVAAALERGGLRLRSRSPLSVASRRVLDVLAQRPKAEAA